jgi:acetylglutamate kinase
MQSPLVLKIGGNNLDEPQFIDNLAQTVAQYGRPVIIVHGGGKEISQMQKQFGLTPQYVDGLRVSDESALQIAEMVLCGMVNTRLVRALQLCGVEAQGLNGADRGLLKAEKLIHPNGDLGRVGKITQVRAEVLLQLLAEGVTPVIAPICLGNDGAFNVNADHVAGAVAEAVGASQVIFITNVQGVQVQEQVLGSLTATDAQNLMNTGVIWGGMLPKVQTALHLLSFNIPQVMITNLAGILSGHGTAIIPETHRIQTPTP